MTPFTPTMSVKSDIYFDCVTDVWLMCDLVSKVGISTFSNFGLSFDSSTYKIHDCTAVTMTYIQDSSIVSHYYLLLIISDYSWAKFT